MSKDFFSVFSTLELSDKHRGLIEDTSVEKIVVNKERTRLRIYVCSDHLIPKKMIEEITGEIKNQLFEDADTIVEIMEQFVLSKQYTPEQIFKLYEDSLIYEIRKKSELMAHIFNGARFDFAEEGTVVLTLEEGMIYKEVHRELITLLSAIFEERFQLMLHFKICYKEPIKKKNEDKDTYGGDITDILNRNETGKSVNKANQTNQIVKKKAAGGKTFRRTKKVPKDPNTVYGHDFDDEPIPLSQVVDEMGEITFCGQIIELETREIRNEKSIVSMTVTDFTDSIKLKLFIGNEDLAELLGEVKQGEFVKIKGVTAFDSYDGELGIRSVSGMKRISDFRNKRIDNSVKKRVELHCHTKMSDMDGISDVRDIVKRAHDWGHKAIAITDHGVVQAFPDANHFIEKLDKNDPFKIIYGVEGYLVDDLQDIAINEKGQTIEDAFVVFDLETTGFSAIRDKIIEIGAVKIENGAVTDSFSTYVNPGIPIPYEITKLTGIEDHMVMEAPAIEEVLPAFMDFIGDAVLVAHNAGFDVGFIEQSLRYQNKEPDLTSLDTMGLARVLLPQLGKYKLNVIAKALGIRQEHHHRAEDDARVTAEMFLTFVDMLKDKNIITLQKINQHGKNNNNIIKKSQTFHVILLAQNDIGRVNLYTLISKSHLDYFSRKPRIPKTELSKYREGILVGSACEAGEVFSGLLREKSPEDMQRIVNYYDYLEIQPLGNNRFMIDSERYPHIQSDNDLIELNKRVIALGEQYDKPVIATGDVHFLDPEDEIYRKIIMTGKGFDDADRQPPLFFRTTEEMLAEFEYLGEEKAKEVVIENPDKIAEAVEKISPVRPDKCPPVIPDSDKNLREICYEKAHQMYGENLPEVVTERLERELNSIISNGFAVMYIIAQKLVWKSNEDGYLVGSRGSVGSSFVATMAGITEVNPLSPHYYCRKCHYSDFDSEEVRAFAGGCGWDMPDKVCPVCGEPLVKDGFDIPFETFLGFKGNKEPDIDLNFSGEYQGNAHKYTEVIFGEGQTFRAGTIGTLADKTAYGYVKNYFEERGIQKRKCEIARIVRGCTGIRRSTGQHPGGIVVLPHGENIYSFTPVQHPANDMHTDIITTHFDYHSIDHNLLKLDILGHDDPTMIRALEMYITSPAFDNEFDEEHPFKATDIPLDDQQVMSLFHGTEALGIRPEDIEGCRLGCLGIPEFGTDFVIQMVVDAKPRNLSDLIRISGLSHGTDVWLNNAQELIRSGKATISTAICTRDDIMTYLIGKGMDSELSFTIMESVRKGKGLKPDFEKAMSESGVPDWYIWSCKKIKYMFPKAHAAAYVMMAYRIAYCKIYYPVAYYAAYLSIRADAFSYELMCQGKEHLNYCIKDYLSRSDTLSKKEQDTLKDMRIVQEMYARGIEFLPLDIYKSRAYQIQIVDGKLLPPLSSIEGMGEKAAELVEQAGKEGRYLSRDDFRQRSKVTKTVAEHMAELGLLDDLPESNQLSLFDV